MTLAFSEKINGQPSYFPEKIWSGLINDLKISIAEYEIISRDYQQQFGKEWDCPGLLIHSKIHTIREDKFDRWKAGMDIHMVVNNRSEKRFQFAPVIKVKSTQYFQIIYENGLPTVYVGDTKEDWMPFFYYDEETGGLPMYGEDQMKELAINDGFDSIEDFFKYFSTNFEGKIIHWTMKKY